MPVEKGTLNMLYGVDFPFKGQNKSLGWKMTAIDESQIKRFWNDDTTVALYA